MLTRLLIRNVALIDELNLEFGAGLNALSGETGAGKSIVVDAINLLLGARADRAIIRTGEEKAYAEGLFSDVQYNAQVMAVLGQMGLEAEDGDIILSREYSMSGKNVCRVNGVATTLSQLRQLAANLVDVHGQHEHQSLLDERRHMEFVDALGDEAHRALTSDLRLAYEQYVQQNNALRDMRERSAQREDRTQLLQTRRKELELAHVQPGEEAQLSQRLDQLRNAGRITQALQRAYGALYDSAKDENAASTLLRQASVDLEGIAGYDERFSALAGRLKSLFYEAEDIGLELRNALRDFSSDDASLAKAAERMDLLRRLSRKFGIPCDDMAQELENINGELRQLEGIEEEVALTEAKRGRALQNYQRIAQKLSASRRQIAGNLQVRMENELTQLHMKGTRVEIQVTAAQHEPMERGLDQVRMLLAPNKGEEAKDLSRIASGGEISRMMLAFKTIAAEHNTIPTMVFDEIDTGISGRTAQVVAEKLWEISRYRQVFCVTHLQQIAAMASSQYLVEKYEDDGRTKTSVLLLNNEGRTKEISRMISGISADSRSSMEHGAVLLAEAEAFRRAHPSAPQ